MLVIENGLYSDWNYNRIQALQIICFIFEFEITLISILHFEFEKKQIDFNIYHSNFTTYILIATTFFKIVTLLLKNKAELYFWKSKLFET